MIGPATDYAPDEEVATSLYEVLEKQVLPLFFDRNEQGLPLGLHVIAVRRHPEAASDL